MREFKFTVDAALFRELGERLVGRPHIALAELVKNSYDADATEVVIRVEEDRIDVVDNGHGMTVDEFRDYWMRVGSPHKQKKRVSRNFGRRMTGSKGVGRLSAQFLGTEIEIRTVSDRNPQSELQTFVDWSKALKADDLTEAVARYREVQRQMSFPGDSSHGTMITILDLNQNWDVDRLRGLAREIWWLQPPFGRTPDQAGSEEKAFNVRLEGPDPKAIQEFERQMEAYHDIWYARLTGTVEASPQNDGGDTEGPTARVTLEFEDGTNMTEVFDAPKHCPRCVDFEIRIYHLKYRQPHGIRVNKAREYFNEHGGVHVYDAGFHLPYYGPDNDWLNIEMDHSHRLERSKLLPDELQVSGGLTFLPTQSRILGVVNVNTAREQELAQEQGREKQGDYLKIQVTRDRLVDNEAYQGLRKVVRWAIDYYTMQEAKRAFEEAEAERDVEPVQKKFERVEEVLQHHADAIPEPVYSQIRDQVQEAITASESEAEARARQVGLLGSLATAGMSALAYEHEAHKQMQSLREISSEIRSIGESLEGNPRKRLASVSDEIDSWINRARGTRELFSYLLEEDNRETESRFRAKAVVDRVRNQMEVFLRGIPVGTEGIDPGLRLPPGRFAEWSAIFQNVFLNAVNAMLDSDDKMIDVSSETEDSERSLLIQDTGTGVDPDEAPELFEPFERRQNISRERRELGYGGSGLGLTIVRMIAEKLNCRVDFVEPQPTFSTAFRLRWKEEE